MGGGRESGTGTAESTGVTAAAQVDHTASAGSEVPGGQLALDVRLRDEATLESFVPGPATAALLPLLRAGSEPLILLHGPSGGGKTHLLQAACQHNRASALYLPMTELCRLAPAEVLSGLEQLDLLCLDDLHRVLDEPAWALALFDCFHRCQQTGCRWLVAARRPPAALSVALADLQSRLSAGLVFALPAPDEALRRQILRARAHARGMRLSEDVLSYVERRAGRSLDALLALLDELDQATLRAGRPLSVPFVRQLMRW